MATVTASPSLSVVGAVGSPSPASNIGLLMEASANANKAKLKLGVDNEANEEKLLIALATAAAKSVDAASFVTKRAELRKIEDDSKAQQEALDDFIERFDG